MRGGEPHPAAWQLLLDVRDDHPIRGEHEADQLVLGPKRAGDRTTADGVRRLAILLLLSLRRRLPQTPGLLALSSVACARARLLGRRGALIGSGGLAVGLGRLGLRRS